MRFGRGLQRILQRANLAALCRLLKVRIGHLNVVFRGYRNRVADLLANRGDRMLASQIGFAACSQIVKQPGPWFQSRPIDYLLKRGSQVTIDPALGTLGRR
jgi:hypothetical protein